MTNTLPASLQYIKDKLSAEKELLPNQMRRIILDAQVNQKDLMPWADFDHPATDGYGRKLVHHGGHFEIMVMSWVPGDYSAIHDHGYTQWGAVQVFGPAEHATFRVKEGKISTLDRWIFNPGDVVGVSHDLVHQMGNTTENTRFLSLHVYGQKEDIESITGDARIFDLENNTIQRVDGGVFFALPSKEIKSTEAGPVGDFPTKLRYMLELTKRLNRMKQAGTACQEIELNEVIKNTFSLEFNNELVKSLAGDNAEQNYTPIYKRSLKKELQEAIKLQEVLLGDGLAGLN